MKLGERYYENLYYFCNFSGNLIIIPEQNIYFKMSCWENATKGGMGDQEKGKNGQRSRQMTRPSRVNWAERKHICRFDMGSSGPSPRWHLLSLSERRCYH